MNRRDRIYGKRRKRSLFKQKPKPRKGTVYVGDKQFSDKPMYEGHEPSTHLMAYGESDGKYVAFPTLFQDDSGMWSEGGFKEAKEKGEVYRFDTEKEASDFAAGNWKNR